MLDICFILINFILTKICQKEKENIYYIIWFIVIIIFSVSFSISSILIMYFVLIRFISWQFLLKILYSFILWSLFRSSNAWVFDYARKLTVSVLHFNNQLLNIALGFGYLQGA